jgi:hypothetical protein
VAVLRRDVQHRRSIVVPGRRPPPQPARTTTDATRRIRCFPKPPLNSWIGRRGLLSPSATAPGRPQRPRPRASSEVAATALAVLGRPPAMMRRACNAIVGRSLVRAPGAFAVGVARRRAAFVRARARQARSRDESPLRVTPAVVVRSATRPS